MIWKWLHRENRDQLILFCNGWGMDETPFVPLKSRDYDVLMLANYGDLATGPDFGQVFSAYRSCSLVGWSMGVWAGQQLFGAREELFVRAVAVNGTLYPRDDRYGIPEKIFDATMEGWNEAARLKFYRRMCRNKELSERFLANQPTRGIDDQQRELVLLQNQLRTSKPSSPLFTDIIISDKDFIIPTVNQYNFWKEGNITEIEGPHFPFYSYDSWDGVIGF
ncbi:MAG: pimeloyl-ACP methyl esterase BioG family protein [Thermodesulfobacteriota bacterium]